VIIVRDETFDYLENIIFYLTESLNDDTLSEVEMSELNKALHIVEEIRDNR
jgi:hypothetical protein